MPAPHTSPWDHLAAVRERPAIVALALEAVPAYRRSRARRLGALVRAAFVPGAGGRRRARSAAAAILRLLLGAAVLASTVVFIIAAVARIDLPPAVRIPAGAFFLAWLSLAMLRGIATDAHRDRELRGIAMRRRRLAHFRGRGPDDTGALHELAARRLFWTDDLRRTVRRLSLREAGADPLASVLIGATALTSAAVVTAGYLLIGPAADPRSHPGRFAGFIGLGIWGGIALGLVRARRGKRAMLRSLEQFTCPDCGYDLVSTLPSADPADLVPWIAPPRCPECGSPYPLIPAPVPHHETPEGLAHNRQKPIWSRDLFRREAI